MYGSEWRRDGRWGPGPPRGHWPELSLLVSGRVSRSYLMGVLFVVASQGTDDSAGRGVSHTQQSVHRASLPVMKSQQNPA